MRTSSIVPIAALTVGGLFSSLAAAQALPWIHPDGTTHWYHAIPTVNGVTWQQAHSAAADAGGYLATIQSLEEAQFVFGLINAPEFWWQDAISGQWDGPWIGGFQAEGAPEPANGWDWSQAQDFAGYTDWTPGQPDNDSGGADRVHIGGSTAGRVSSWGDRAANHVLRSYVIEYSDTMFRRTAGLVTDRPGHSDGYVLCNPLFSTDTFLVDMRGRLVNTWHQDTEPGISAYLRPNGNLLRCGRIPNARFTAGGWGGSVEEYDWDNNLVWKFSYSSPNHSQHHDVALMPNGHVLVVAWELVTGPDAIAAGRDPALLPQGEVWPEHVIEIDPAHNDNIVWEWHAWDHLIQDFDSSKANYGNVGQHPELIDVNYAINGGEADWMHVNAIDYNPALDQIMLSSRSFDELWIIDHSTPAHLVSGHTGGNRGKGGDLLYRWGNPKTYRGGTVADQKLFKQHNAQWIEPGLPGAGNILVFNNGTGRPGGHRSSSDELVPPVDANGNYLLTGAAYGPTQPTWTYNDPNHPFYSAFVAGTQRLSNGNTMICSGAEGFSFEVTPAGQRVWEYHLPTQLTANVPQGTYLALNLMFRSPQYDPGYGAFAGRNLTPGEPIETYTAALLVEGSSANLQMSPGQSAQLTLISPPNMNGGHVLVTSATPGKVPLDYRFALLGYDALLEATLTRTLPTVFQDYYGRLDSSGRNYASINLPPLPILSGLTFYTTAVIVSPTARAGVEWITNTVAIEIQ